MKIFLLDKNSEMCKAWEKSFSEDDVTISCTEFASFMKEKIDIDCIVSPANSFGIMDGGYDAAITDYFGDDLMKKVQKKIKELYKGIQPVGSAITVGIDHNTKLIHVPSMMFPEKITDYKVIFQCMLSTLIEAGNNDVKKIVIPAFGACTGHVPFNIVAEMMHEAYCFYFSPTTATDDWVKINTLVSSLERIKTSDKNKARLTHTNRDIILIDHERTIRI